MGAGPQALPARRLRHILRRNVLRHCCHRIRRKHCPVHSSRRGETVHRLAVRLWLRLPTSTESKTERDSTLSICISIPTAHRMTLRTRR